ncbi:MAG: C25 family cysteine peptidase [Chloroflexi bacterium]|nr:C25 family cysteine peptidase [Chloroflexota bacterium]
MFKMSSEKTRALRGMVALVAVLASVLTGLPSQVAHAAPQAVPGVDPNFYKLTINQTGMVKVTYEAMDTAGLPVMTLDPTTFQIYEQGTEVARRIVDADSSGTFNAGDYVLFYGRGVNTLFTGTNVYWLTYGVAPGRDMVARDGTPDSGLPAVSAFRDTVHLEQNKTWRGDVPLTGYADRWYWQFYDATCRPTCVPFTFTNVFSLPNPATGVYTATLTPRLRGYSTRGHLALFYVNGTSAGQATFNWQDEFLGSLSFSQTPLVNGSNILTFTVPLDGQSTRDTGFINWFNITYSRTYTAPASGQFAFGVDAASPVSVTLAGVLSSTTAIYDITDPLNPRPIGGVAVDGSGPFALSFAHQLTAAARYIAAAPGQLLTPGAITLDAPSHLRNPTQGADWIVISHQNFLTAAERLAEHRRSRPNFRTAVVDVQDIYDEFNGGLPDQEAIRAFIRYAYENWPRPAPAYVVLLGDGHYDPRDYLNYHTTSYIPPFLAPVDNLNGMTDGDNRYVAYDPTPPATNPAPFMHLGRLPANTLTEAQAMVDKIIAYETTPPDPAWKLKTVFVADNFDPLAGDFWASSDVVAVGTAHLPAEYSRITETLYYAGGLASDVTDGIVNAINGIDANNSGAFLVSYNGHASPRAWASESLWPTDALPRLTNAGRYPIMLPMTCLEGYFINPNPGSGTVSMGESIVRMTNAGAVASWSPTGKGVAAGHDVIFPAFYDAIFKQGITEIGPATTYAKQVLFNGTSTFKDLIDTYILFGDPAMSFNLAAPDLLVQKHAQPSGYLLPGQQVTYLLTYRNIGDAPAAGVVLTDTLPAEIIASTWSAGDPLVTALPGQTFAWQLPDLAPNASGVITVTGTVTPGLPLNTVVTNTTNIRTTTWEPPQKLANNTSQVENAAVQPTGFALESFTAKWALKGARIEWTTRNETGINGFNLYRSRTDGEHGVQLNPELIPATAPPDGSGDYSLRDTGTLPGQVAYYWLEIAQPELSVFAGPITPQWTSQVFLPLVRKAGHK